MNHVKTLIGSNPKNKKEKPEHNRFLEIAELFYDTIQGEGINLGQPSAFLRVQHCTQNCWWCDTKQVWRSGNPYSFEELFELIENSDLLQKLREGQHLILTGGSPMKQQIALTAFLNSFIDRYEFKPTIEIENECTLMPTPEFSALIDVWNNSPKLKHSGNPDSLRYRPHIINHLAHIKNAWFKFVISKEEDWDEIEDSFLKPDLIQRSQIILMPLAGNRNELHANRQTVVDISIRESVRYCSREHIELWDKATGV